MFNWRKRLSEWRAVLARKGVKVSTFALGRALLSGPVPPDVWRDRMRVCLRCPVYDAELRACRKEAKNGVGIGCGCYVPFKALTAAPYTLEGGCWAREVTKEAYPADAQEGWPAYRFPSRWAKIRAIFRFITTRA